MLILKIIYRMMLMMNENNALQIQVFSLFLTVDKIAQAGIQMLLSKQHISTVC